MQLGGLPDRSGATDVGAAMRAAVGYGQRPAVIVLRPPGRQEQGFSNLLQWASKVSHWLETDHGLGPGDRLGLATPAGWLPAATALGAWWSGLEVVGGGGGADLAVVHEHAPRPPRTQVAVVGDAFDGRPTQASPGTGEALTSLVQLFPDQPPPTRARPEAPALARGGGTMSQHELLEQARAWDTDGPLGLTVEAEPQRWLPAVALRPLVTGHASVVLDRVSRETAAADRVAHWLPPPVHPDDGDQS